MERIDITESTLRLGQFGNFFIEKGERQEPGDIDRITVTTIAGDGTPGFLDGPALTAKFKSPIDVAILPDGTIYVADGFNSSIRKIANGLVTTFAGNGNANITDANGSDARFKIPSRLTLDMEGSLYTLDAADPRIRKVTSDADVSIYAGAKTFGYKDGDIHTAQFGQSFGIVADEYGNIYLADSQNDRIRKISVTKKVTTVAGSGIQGYANGTADIAQFYFATGIAIDKKGNLFVSDGTRIRKITPAGIVSTFAGSNVRGYMDGKGGTARFSKIEDIAIDEKGNIYATDENRIRKITPQGIASTVAGSTAGYEDGDAVSAKFNGPQGLAIDKWGNIYVADFNNRRIRKINFQ